MKNNFGFAAISSVIIIGVIALSILVSTSLMSISESQMSLGLYFGENASRLVESCAEDCLLRLNKTNTLPTSITTPFGSCSLTINSQSGKNWDFTINATKNNYSKSIRIQAVRDQTITVNSWQPL